MTRLSDLESAKAAGFRVAACRLAKCPRQATATERRSVRDGIGTMVSTEPIMSSMTGPAQEDMGAQRGGCEQQPPKSHDEKRDDEPGQDRAGRLVGERRGLVG